MGLVIPRESGNSGKKDWIPDQVRNDTFESEIKQTTELAHAYKTYEDLKAKQGVMDFSDLISNTLRLFRTRPHILKNYQNQWSNIF